MKKFHFLATMALLALCACGGKQYNPESKDSLSEQERAKRIAQKRADTESSDSLTAFQGNIKITPLTPAGDGIPTGVEGKMERRLLQLLAANGISGLGGDPRYVLAPVVSVGKSGVTSTAPVRHFVEYNITFYVADVVTGTVFATTEKSVKGVGNSDEQAALAAFDEIRPTDAALTQMLQTAETKIKDYYTQHGNDFIEQAKMLAAKQDYGQAIAVLSSVPTEAGATYTTAVQMMAALTPKYLAKESSLALSQLKAALVRGTEADVKEAIFYYSQIVEGSPCKKEADQLIREYKVDVAKQKASEAESQRLQAELQAKIAISSNKCLLDKYKKDAAYNRLPWIRKVFYFGDNDPFDGYTPEKGC